MVKRKRSTLKDKPRRAPSKPKYQVFVSHATSDKWIAATFCEKIEAIGASTFRDDRDINGGDGIPQEIRSQIQQSRELIVLLTPDSIDRPWVLLEVGAAWGRRKNYRIVPVLCHVTVDAIPDIIEEGISLERVRSISEGTSESDPPMTATLNQTCDVFISHAVSDSAVAVEVAESLEAVGLTSFHTGTVPPGADLSDLIWDALAESRAVIAIVTGETPFPSMGLVEIGAAAAWNKPVYVLIHGPSTTKLPSALASYPVYPLGRLGEVIQVIRGSFQPLTEIECSILTDAYQHLGISVDQLSQSPKALRELTATFAKRAGKQLSGERLQSELLRLRKNGRLPRLRSRN